MSCLEVQIGFFSTTSALCVPDILAAHFHAIHQGLSLFIVLLSWVLSRYFHNTFYLSMAFSAASLTTSSQLPLTSNPWLIWWLTIIYLHSFHLPYPSSLWLICWLAIIHIHSFHLPSNLWLICWLVIIHIHSFDLPSNLSLICWLAIIRLHTTRLAKKHGTEYLRDKTFGSDTGDPC